VKVTVIIPCRNEQRYIGACLDSIVASALPHDQLEVLVVDGRSDDETRAIVQRYGRRHPWIRLVDNPDRIVPSALNRGIAMATGGIIVRMDAHVVYPPDYLPRLVDALMESGADNVGGRIVTLAADERPVARAIAIALAHPFAVGNSWFRIGTSEQREVDTVPFGCYRRDAFARFGLFDERLVRNQDDEFNHRLIRRGGRILLIPDVVAYYYARDSLRKLARMYYQYGYFKPLVAKCVRRVMTVRQLVPAIFVTVLALLGLAAFFSPAAAIALLLVTGSYAAGVFVVVLTAVHRHGLRAALALLLALPVIHLSYGFGFLRGLRHLLPRAPGARAAASVPMSR
jgi:glycosyltransferase involved in cell wall biosynthesis